RRADKLSSSSCAPAFCFDLRRIMRILPLLNMGMEKKDLGHLPLAAKVYITLLSLAALFLACWSVRVWPPSQVGEFALYLLFAVASSKMKVSLPGITGTLSVNYLFIMAGVTDLGWPQTVAIGCAGGVAQLILSARKRPRNVQVLFTMASM